MFATSPFFNHVSDSPKDTVKLSFMDLIFNVRNIMKTLNFKQINYRSEHAISIPYKLS